MKRQRDMLVWVYHVNGDGTNQDTLLCCRVWSESRDIHKPLPRFRLHTSWFESWSPAHRSQSTDSMTTTPPKAHALQTPTNIRTTWGWEMRDWSEHPIAGRRVREWEKHEISNESESTFLKKNMEVNF